MERSWRVPHSKSGIFDSLSLPPLIVFICKLKKVDQESGINWKLNLDKTPNSTRMTGMDQFLWNLTNDQDLFCIWAIARLEEPLKDDLIKKSLDYLIKTIPILNSKPIVNWLFGNWQYRLPGRFAAWLG